MTDCLFCKIVAGEIPAKIVYENKDAVAFLDIAPRAPGHTMVVSRTHSPNLAELPDGAVGPLFTTVKKVAKRLTDVLKSDGHTIGINQGKVSGQTVEHLHVHVIPRFGGDGGSSLHSVVSNPPAETLDELVQKIKFHD